MRTCILDIETEGLEPWNDRLICIGVRDVNGSKTMVFFDEDEETTLRRFIIYYKRSGFDEVVGYNVSYDFRFLFAKCMKYEIKSPEFFDSKFTDLMDNVRSVRRMFSYNKPGKLEDWVQFLFGTSKLEKGDSVKTMFENREFTRILQYCKQDVDLTYMLWKRIRLVLCQK